MLFLLLMAAIQRLIRIKYIEMIKKKTKKHVDPEGTSETEQLTNRKWMQGN